MSYRWSYSYPNPFQAPLVDFSDRLMNLKFSGSSVIPNALVAAVLIIVIGLLALFWIYGVVINIQRRLWDYVTSAQNEMKGKSLIDKVPYTITIGVFFIIYLPFFFICVPYYCIGIVGRILSSI